MHPAIEHRLAVHGFVTRPFVLGLGLTDKHLTRLNRGGDLSWIGPGLYADRHYPTMTDEDQHRLRCHAVATRFTDSVAFTHQSAALLHGLPTFGVDLDDLHVTRLDVGRGRKQAHVRHHVAELAPDEVGELAGLSLSTLPRTLWDVACQLPTESALVTVDAALHRGLVTDDELLIMAGRYTSWRSSRQAKVTLSLTDGQAESPGESRSRWAFHEGGLPRPISQYKIFDQRGVLAGIADFAWPEFRHLVEFDGMIKYRSVADLAREKAREDLLRSLGWGVTRIIWSQLAPALRAALIDELASAMERSRRLYGSAA